MSFVLESLHADREPRSLSSRHALREAGMTFSTDVTPAVDIRSAPSVEVHGGHS